MRLRTRFSLVLAAFSLAILMAAILLTRAVLVQTSANADEERSRAALERGVNVLHDDAEALLRTAMDWASWDNTYAFMANRNRDYVEANLVEGTLKDLRLCAIVYFDTNREVAASLVTGPDGHRVTGVPGWLESLAKRPAGLLDRLGQSGPQSGFLADGGELWLVAGAPILTSREEGPPRGVVVMVRHIDAPEVDRLSRLIHVSLVLSPADKSWMPGRTDIRVLSARALVARTVIADVFGSGRILLDLTVSRDAFQQITVSLLYLAAWIAVCGIAVTLFSFWILDRWVLRSVTESVSVLRSGLGSAASANGKPAPLTKRHADEIGELVDAVNASLAALEASQAHIRASEARYRVLVETMREAIAGVDQADRLLFSNRALERLAGAASPGELVGRTLREVLSPSFSDAVAAVRADLARGGVVELGPVAVRVAGGAERWVTAFLAPVGPVAELPAYTLICLRDVTAKLEAEREADQRRAEAVQAQRLAALGTLVAGVAHEVNNPNGIVHLNMHVLRRCLERLSASRKEAGAAATDPADHPAKRELEREMNAIVEETLAASERIAGLVASLKSFAQPADSGPAESVDMGELIRRSSGWVRHEMRKKQCRLECDPAVPGLRVRGHAQQLQQVCINLLQNACDAAERPDTLIRISEALSPDGRTVTITVRDEGRGIPREDLDHVLDPFFTTRRGEGGTGLGLSISSAIVKAHGGVLRVQSTPGQGTVVTMTLPVEKEGDDAV